MQNKLLLSVLSVCILLFAACDTETPTPKPSKSMEISSSCHAPYQSQLASGNTRDMRNAYARINECLEKHIMDLAVDRLGGNDSLAIMESSLNNLRTGAQKIYWEIANENITCRPTCGSINHITHLLEYKLLLIKILDDLTAINLNPTQKVYK